MLKEMIQKLDAKVWRHLNFDSGKVTDKLINVGQVNGLSQVVQAMKIVLFEMAAKSGVDVKATVEKKEKERQDKIVERMKLLEAQMQAERLKKALQSNPMMFESLSILE